MCRTKGIRKIIFNENNQKDNILNEVLENGLRSCDKYSRRLFFLEFNHVSRYYFKLKIECFI